MNVDNRLEDVLDRMVRAARASDGLLAAAKALRIAQRDYSWRGGSPSLEVQIRGAALDEAIAALEEALAAPEVGSLA